MPMLDYLIKAGVFADKCGDYRRGAWINEQLVTLVEAEFGAEDTRTATALNNLAESYRARGRFEEAEPLYRRALEILRKVHGDDHPQTQKTAANYAAFLDRRG